ncbi:OmpA family protein [Nitrogeniibacter aestuarii]|uniref:OmpA family protein n=1 Tax=Nitrogeniibacter aestuarii TaxID=2815343 RepID=UPI001E4E0EA7|nr:OmpA family protein [Nitrogeniibacter aestuarii]
MSRIDAAQRLIFLCALIALATPWQPVAAEPLREPVKVSGTVPDEATRAEILARLRDIYGPKGVIDAIEVGGVVPPPNWKKHVTAMITDDLKGIRQGQLHIDGTQVQLSGQVGNEAQRQGIASRVATALNPTYVVDNELVVVEQAQEVIDATLADRIIEFQSGSAQLTDSGIAVLDEMAQAIARFDGAEIQVVGHTDDSGSRMANIALSLSRANAVRDYLMSKGIDGGRIMALGAGPDKPITTNDTAEGRARNRRIEFRMLN